MDRPERIHVTLFENKPNELEGDTTIRASLKDDGSVDLVDSIMTCADTREVGQGKAFKARKFTPNQPDLRGTLQIPYDRAREPDPGHWEVAGWWRWTCRGKRSLYLCLTACKTSSKQQEARRSAAAA